MTSFTFVVKDPMGLHARPAGLLAQNARQYTSRIFLMTDNKSGNAKHLFHIMGLGIKNGDTVKVTIEGENEVTDRILLERFIRENDAFE